MKTAKRLELSFQSRFVLQASQLLDFCIVVKFAAILFLTPYLPHKEDALSSTEFIYCLIPVVGV